MSIRNTIIHKIVDFDKFDIPRFDHNLWNIRAFAFGQMSMWETIASECTSTECTAMIFVYMFTEGVTTRHLPFYKNVMDNPFVYPCVKELFSTWFSQMQRTYWAFSRLALRWIWKKPRIQIRTDLYMNDLEISHPHTYPLMQLRNVYLFTLSNLVNLIMTAICHANHFCHEPLPIKNPYNNLPLSKADLYNIYLRVCSVYIKVPFFFRRFFECDFNIYRFKVECETELREHSIKEYVKIVEARDVFADIQMMIHKYDPNCYMRISSRVDRQIVVAMFRPFLASYYLSLYSFNRFQQSYYEMKLARELTRFIYTNHMFGQKTGRKIPSSQNPFIDSDVDEYHLKYIRPSPVKLNTEHFMHSHIFRDDVFDRYTVQGDVDSAYAEPVRIGNLRSSDLFLSNIRGPNTDVVDESESEDEDQESNHSESDEDAPVIIEEDDQLSEVTDYPQDEEEEQEEDDYDW